MKFQTDAILLKTHLVYRQIDGFPLRGGGAKELRNPGNLSRGLMVLNSASGRQLNGFSCLSWEGSNSQDVVLWKGFYLIKEF